MGEPDTRQRVVEFLADLRDGLLLLADHETGDLADKLRALAAETEEEIRFIIGDAETKPFWSEK